MEASISGVEFQMSARPSPSKSTACLRNEVGMNCGWPSAPAQDDFIAAREARPLLDDLQCRQHFLAEHVLARRQERLGAQHLEGIVGNLRRAKAGFAAPDRQHHVARHAISLSRSRRASWHSSPPRARPPARHGADGLFGEIIAGRAEFGLMLLLRRLGFFARHDQIRQLQIGLDRRKMPRRRSFSRCLRLGLRPQIVLQPGLELVVDFGCGGGGQCARRQVRWPSET